MSSKEEIYDKGFFACDSLDVTTLSEEDRHKYVCMTGWQRAGVKGKGNAMPH